MKTQIHLTQTEQAALRALTQTTGRTEEDVLHEALARFLEGQPALSRLTRLQQAAGLWKDRDDLPDWNAMRHEWERSRPSEEPENL